MNVLAAFLAGALFALGLALSGMTEPARIVSFLDLTGDWDPTLAFVMGGALLVYAPLYRIIVGQLPRPLMADAFALPPVGKVDRKLLTGAALFGVGWGLAGFCPGPAVVALGAGKLEALVFTASMIAGSWLAARLPGVLRTGARGQSARVFASDDAYDDS